MLYPPRSSFRRSHPHVLHFPHLVCPRHPPFRPAHPDFHFRVLAVLYYALPSVLLLSLLCILTSLSHFILSFPARDHARFSPPPRTSFLNTPHPSFPLFTLSFLSQFFPLVLRMRGYVDDVPFVSAFELQLQYLSESWNSLSCDLPQCI